MTKLILSMIHLFGYMFVYFYILIEVLKPEYWWSIPTFMVLTFYLFLAYGLNVKYLLMGIDDGQIDNQ